MAARDHDPPKNKKRSPLSVPTPPTRSLQVYAVDPSTGKNRYASSKIIVQVPWEPLDPGPTGKKIAVIDYDAGGKCYYPPINLEDRLLLANHGLDPSEGDPRFHQQMVYAIASRTIHMFEVALGRDIHWRRADRFGDSTQKENHMRKQDDIHVLKLYPHAMQQANAYYSPQAHGILFGYFKADKTQQGRNLPGQLVFTCLSQDIIAHEVTHAVIDGIRTYFTEPTNPDVLAFHEGFADLCALFSHFSQYDSLIDTIGRTGGLLYQTDLNPISSQTGKGQSRTGEEQKPQFTGQISAMNPLVQLAIQFGQASGSKYGLRSALGTPPNSDDYHKKLSDPHFRGSILVAAVFDAFFTVYMVHADVLFRIYRAGGSSERNDDLPAPLAQLLAGYASQTAISFFQLCARAIDYCPPVDITFGDFLRALITVSKDIDPVDDSGVRDALMEAFRVRGIFSETASFYSEDALAWSAESDLPPVRGLVFGSPNGLTSAEKNHNGDVLRDWANKNRAALGLDPKLPLTVPSFHPVFRTKDNGRLRVEMVVEVIQSRQADFDPAVPEAGSFPFRGGVTLIIEAPELKGGHGPVDADPAKPMVRFAIGKGMTSPSSKLREAKQRSFAMSLGMATGDTTDPAHFQANFGLVHEESRYG